MGFISTEPLNSKSELPVSNGATRFWTSKICPFAQRVWIAINYKGLNDSIQFIEIDLQDRPTWYKEKIYSVGKVPALEHNNKVIGESLDLLDYLDNHFPGPKLTPEDKKKELQDVLQHLDILIQELSSHPGGPDIHRPADIVPGASTLDFLEATLGKYAAEGPFILGKFGLADVAIAPFFERFQIRFQDIMNYDITAGRPNSKNWFEAMNKLDAYTQTRMDPQVLLHHMNAYLASRATALVTTT